MSKAAILAILFIAAFFAIAAGAAYLIYFSGEQGSYAGQQQKNQQDTVQVGQNGKEAFLASSSGKPLYYYDNDEQDKSNCAGKCLQSYKPFFAGPIVVSGILSPSDFKQIANSEGAYQTTYKGSPLYLKISDVKKSEQKHWHLMNP